MGYQEYRKDAMACLTWHASGCRICWGLGIIFALLGVIAAATEIMLGLGAVSWLLLASINQVGEDTQQSFGNHHVFSIRL